MALKATGGQASVFDLTPTSVKRRASSNAFVLGASELAEAVALIGKSINHQTV